jgi:hypothetical protein
MGKMNKKFDDVLNECFDRLISGDSIQSCLKDYPEYAAELEPLLKTAITTLQATDIRPRPEFRQRAAWEFQKAAQNLKQRRAEHSPLKWQLRWLIPVTAVFAVLVAGTGTVFAANSSLPDQALYGVKLFTENARLAMTSSAAGKAQLNAEFADERVNEIIIMADKGKVDQVERAAGLLNNNLTEIAKLIKPVEETATAETMTAGTATSPAFGTAAAITSTPDKPTPTAPAITTPTSSNTPPPAITTPDPATTATTEIPTPTLTIASTPQVTQKPTPLIGPIIIATPTQTSTQSSAPIQKADASATITASSAASENATAFKSMPKPTATINQDDKDRLRTTVSQQAEKNNARLSEALKRVPDSAKPSLEKAINDANKGYDNALKNFSGNTSTRK